MKASGAEILAFWHEWPPGDDWCYAEEDSEVAIYDDDREATLLDPAVKYDLGDFAVITWQGRGRPPSAAPMQGQDYVEFQCWFSFWKRARTVVSVDVEVPKEQIEEFMVLMREKAWKVLK